jgi:hypothetical protein
MILVFRFCSINRLKLAYIWCEAGMEIFILVVQVVLVFPASFATSALPFSIELLWLCC